MSRTRKLFSYVVEHDFGRSPNPHGGYCTLAFCKFKRPGHIKRNIVELAEKGDWIVGTSGKSKLSYGEHGRLIYAMEVTKKLTLREYFRDTRFADRAGNDYSFITREDMFALVSDHFYYFGRNARPLAKRHIERPIERGGRGYLVNFPEVFIADFVQWVTKLRPGINGDPCAEWPEEQTVALGIAKDVVHLERQGKF